MNTENNQGLCETGFVLSRGGGAPWFPWRVGGVGMIGLFE